MDVEILQKLVIELSGIGAGSPEYIENLIKVISSDPEEPRNEEGGNHPWCVCSVCTEMLTPEENKCCGRRHCVTSFSKFSKVCLDKDILEVSIIARADYRADEISFRNNDYRKAAYYQYCLWKYGKLGRGNRRILPACVVTLIRATYPEPNENYMGFRSQ